MADETAGVFVQWKGTDVCLDFTCACGRGGHYDGDFAYVLRCAGCGRLWRMPYDFRLEETVDDGSVIQETDFDHDERRKVAGVAVVEVPSGDAEGA